jgi:ParB family chromosome partitioning protein
MVARTNAEHADLRQIPVQSIDRNPENPRLLFRQKEFDELLESIRIHSVQVPISVYRQGNRYVLIDGERRWRCCLKLNRKTIPALVQAKPDSLSNLLLMFNIHALREQWDLLTISLKLPRVIELLKEELDREPNERELSHQTGLKRAVIRRCKLLIDLPKQYQDLVLKELKRPKAQQRLTEDFFIEMERALKTVGRLLPELLTEKDLIRNVLIDKYEKKTISNIVHFRKLPKIARARNVDADIKRARSVLKRVFSSNSYSIEDAYEDSVAEAYSERDLLTRVQQVLEQLEKVDLRSLDTSVVAALTRLQERLREILERVR